MTCPCCRNHIPARDGFPVGRILVTCRTCDSELRLANGRVYRALTYLAMVASGLGLFWVGAGKLGVVSAVIAAGAGLWLLILRLAKLETRNGDPVVEIPEARIAP